MSVDADGSGLRDDVHVSLTPGPAADPGVDDPDGHPADNAQGGEDDRPCPDTSP